jgi:PAS domain S-box-containing protein
LPGDEHLADVEAVARMGSWRIDLATGVVTISPELRRILGWPPEAEFDAARIGEIVHPDDQAKVRKWLALSAAGTPPKGGHFFRVVGANGRLRTLFGRSALRPEGRAAPDHVCGTIQDVTEQVANESAMTDVAPLYGDIFEHCAWGIFQTTAEGRYLAANPALARIFGYDSPEELMSKVTDIGRQLYVDPQRRDEFVRAITENGVVRGFESEIYRRDGSTIWISVTCRELRASTGQLLYYEGTVDDVSERKRSEAELRAAKEAAEAADRAKTEFLATMSHELRTPLNAVIGFAEAIEKEILGPSGVPAYQTYAGDIRLSGQHLLALINDILDFVKAEHGSLQLQRQEVELSGLVTAVLRLLEPQAQSAGVILESAVHDRLIIRQGDERRLRQILINLLGNAIKFTRDGGRIDIDVSLGAEEQAVIVIRDTGIGMSEHELARIGKPFYQADSSLARRREGTGLGLAICDRLVRLHGGTLTFASEVGKGSTATMLLPGAFRAAG